MISDEETEGGILEDMVEISFTGKECDRLKMGKGLTIQTFVLQVVGISIPVVARALVKGLFFF